jgi:hypothetical protein
MTIKNENTEGIRISPIKSLVGIGMPIMGVNGMKSVNPQDGLESASIAEESGN